MALRTVALVAVMAAISYTEAAAQEVVLKGGLSSSTFDVSPADDPGAPRSLRRNAGAIAGVSIFLTSSKRGGWLLEAVVRQAGAQRVVRFDDEIRLTYLELPLLLHLDVLPRGDGGLYVTAGPSLGVNLRASYAAEGAVEDVRDDIRKVDVGLNVGGGLEAGALVIDARYTWGLRSVFEADERSFKNRTLALTVGVRLRR